MIVLTKEQQYVADELVKGVKKKREQKLGSVAGCGKTTIIRHLRDRLPNFATVAFTGKATSVLRKKGIANASTIHSLIYVPIPLEKGQVIFELRDSLEGGLNGLIIDEASMVNSELYEDMKSFGLPMIFVGDHGQLEPVGNNPNLMKNPDYCLETVHRNAGEIAFFAEWIRHGKIPEEFPTEGKVKFVPAYHKKHIEKSEEIICGADQMICAYNITRQHLNRKYRDFKGFKKKVEVGDRVMCLRNNKKIGLFNGMQGVVTALRKGNVFDIDTDILGKFEKISYHPDVFGTEKIPVDLDLEGTNPFEYAYCATAHKCQGDSWPHVLVFEQICKHWDHKKWAYTAASRAEDKLTWVSAYRKKEEVKQEDDWF